MIIFLLNKLRHKCRKGAIMAAKARAIYYQMDTLINNLRKEVNSFGGYVDITKSMGIKPYIVRKKDERVGCMSLVRLPVASSVSFRPTISEPFIKGFNDFLDDVDYCKGAEFGSRRLLKEINNHRLNTPSRSDVSR